MEEWAIIDIAPNFLISNEGRVRNQITGKIIKAHLNSQGYPRVNLWDEGRYFQKEVHILVAMAFIQIQEEDLDDDDLQVIPLDGNKTNVHFTNLKWGTRQENVKRSYRDGRIPRLRTWIRGDDGIAREELTGEELNENTVFRNSGKKRTKIYDADELIKQFEENQS